ncbi:uncharacterized protein LOC121368916 isoform X2 [Gigantopelta aegis]|nr:uncharacterized protein LOC121368916 isoform X2 [Gigantopelta aegis]
MEELKYKTAKKDLNEETGTDVPSMNDKNLMKSRCHSHMKTVYKDLLKHEGIKKKVRHRKTANGTYNTVMEYPEESDNDSCDSVKDSSDMDNEDGDRGYQLDKQHTTTTQLSTFCPLDKEHLTFHPNGVPRKDSFEQSSPHLESSSKELKTFTRVDELSNLKQAEFGKQEQVTPADEGMYDMNDDKNYSPFLVQADVHPVGPASEILKLSPEKLKSLQQTEHPGVGSSNTNAVTGGKPSTRKVAFQDETDCEEPKSVDEALEMFEEISRKYELGSRLEAIRESVGEDSVSVISEGAYSRSIYGSSEIFDTNSRPHVYFDINDSDLELPPDNDDLLSDCSIPSPLPLSMSRSAKPGAQPPLKDSRNREAEPVSTKPHVLPSGPVFSTFGVYAPKPYNGDRIVKPGEVSSPATPSVQTQNHSAKSDVRKVSPPLPPPPEEFRQPSDADSSFDFPPPPKVFSKSGEYVEFEKKSTKNGPVAETKMMGPKLSGRGYVAGSKYLNLSILSVACILGIISGVYCQQPTSQTTVYITVYAPNVFLANETVVYMNQAAKGRVLHEEDIKVKRYDVEEPILRSLKRRHHCVKHKCEQGCDYNTGKCICLHGYRTKSNGTCEDINECMEGGTSCHSAAGCLNRRGSYDCICSGDYYGNGKSCQACAAPCESGTYEVQPCSVDKQKICRECTKSCPAGEFMLRPCETNRNAVCRTCPQLCPAGEFEYRKCIGDDTRQCKSLSDLPRPTSSKNIIIEDEQNVTDQHFHTKFIPSKFPGLMTFKFDRGEFLSVDVTVKNLQAGLLFVPINSSNGGPFSAVHQSGHTARFCPNSVPEHYILHYNKLNKITFTVANDGTLKPCESHSGSKVGNFPATAGVADTFLYAEPAPMTNLFEIQPDFFHASSVWVERSNRCANHSGRCEECSRSCARRMSQSSSQCSVLGNESDNGFSPRLRVCYSCCSRRECSDVCKDYHKRHCQPKKCLQGSWVQLRVQPRWDSSKLNHFYCHIQPVTEQLLVTLDYRITYQGRPFHREQLQLFSNQEWRQTGRMIHRLNLLLVNVDSKLPSMPDFLEGDLSRGFGLFKVGKYNNEGHPVKSSVVSGESVLIRPIKPFGENNSKLSSPASTVMEYSVIATEQDGPYRSNTDMFVVTYGNDTFPYQVTHRNEAPTLQVTLPRDVSVLEQVFPLVALQHKTLNGNISNNGSLWLVDVMGRTKSCPGLLKVEVTHPDYPSMPLFKFKMAIRCPRKFHLYFEIPTADDPLLEKEMVISFVDNTTRHVLRILKPAPANSEMELNEHQLPIDDGSVSGLPLRVGGASSSGLTGVIFSIPYLASVCGAVVLLLVLAAFGLALAPDLPGPESPNVRLSYIVMMISYVTINFLYSVIITMTIFTAVLVTFNSDNASFISQYKKHTAARSAAHHLELNSMWHHMLMELQRQRTLANVTKVRCEQSVRPVISDIKQLQEDLLAQTEDLVGKENIKSVLQSHAQEALMRLSQDLYSFRDNFNRYVEHLLSQLSHDVEMTLKEVENNKWLAGARFLHGAVINIRKHLNNVSSKKFIDWAHLTHDLSKLNVDASIPLPSIPHFDGIPDPTPEPNGKTRIVRTLDETADHVREVRVHNHWFFPFSESQLHQGQVSRAAKMRSSVSTPSRSATAFYVILGLMVAVDILLFAHRMAKTISFAKLLLYGYPEYVDYKETGDDEGDDDVFHDKTEQSSTVCSSIRLGLKKFCIQVVQTLFIPKAVVTVVVCLLVYAGVRLSGVVLNKQTFHRLGLHYDMNGFLDLQAELMNVRLVSHAEQINNVEMPLYQSWMAAFIERHERALHLHQQQLRTLQFVHNETYCSYLGSLGIDMNCTAEGSGQHREYHISATGCQLSPVWPKFYKRKESPDIGDSQLQALLSATRHIVMDTAQVIVVFLSIIVLKELFGSVLWIYIRRSGFVRLRIIFETSEDQTVKDT